MTSAADLAVLPAVWGVRLTSRRRVAARAALDGGRGTVVAAAVVLSAVLGALGVVTASTGPARADIFGISDAVQDWLCGIVSPTEPWEAVGDGPESWMANKNLTGATPPATLIVGSDGVSVTPAPGSAPTTAPATMDQMPALPAGTWTLYEIAGLRGLSWWTIPANPDGSKNCDLWAYIWTQSANLIFSANKTLLQIIIAIHEAAETSDPLSFLYDASGGILADVFTLFFMPIALIMLIFTAIWLGVQAARGRGTPRQALGAVGAAMAITALGAFAYLVKADGQDGFRGAAKTIDTMISQTDAVATNAIFDHLTNPGQACALPQDAANIRRGIRATSCVLADALAYRPWEIGQFGGTGANPIPVPTGWTILMPTHGVITFAEVKAANGKAIPCYVNFGGCKDLRTYLIAQHGGVQIADTPNGHTGYLICTNSVAPGLATFAPALTQLVGGQLCSPMNTVWQALALSDQATARAYAGEVGIARVSQSFSSILGTGATGSAVVILSLISLSWGAMTFVLYCIGPFKLAFATYAGKVKLAQEWLVDLVYAWLARLVYGIVLGLVVMIIVWLMQADLSFGMRLVWLAVILFTLWRMLQKIQKLIRPGAASMEPDVVGGIRKGFSRAGSQGRRSALGGFDGLRDSMSHARSRIADPTHGRVRRTISTMSSPLSVLGGGVRGAATGRSGAERRMERAVAGIRRPTTPHNPGRAPGNPQPPNRTRSDRPPTGGNVRPPTGGPGPHRTTRKAGTPNPHAVKAKDSPSRVYITPHAGESRAGSNRGSTLLDQFATRNPPRAEKRTGNTQTRPTRPVVQPVSRPTTPKEPARPAAPAPAVTGAPRRPQVRAGSTGTPPRPRTPLPTPPSPGGHRSLPRGTKGPEAITDLPQPALPAPAARKALDPAARRKVEP